MPQKRRDFKHRLTGKSTALATEKLTHGPIKQGWILCLQSIASKDITNACTTLRLVVTGHGYDHLFREQASPSANTLYWTTEPLYLIPGEKLEVHFIGTTSGDLLEAHLTGFMEEAS